MQFCVNAIGNVDGYPKYVVRKFNQPYLSTSIEILGLKSTNCKIRSHTSILDRK